MYVTGFKIKPEVPIELKTFNLTFLDECGIKHTATMEGENIVVKFSKPELFTDIPEMVRKMMNIEFDQKDSKIRDN